MPSQTDVCNDALDQIGQSPITNIDDPTVVANKCKRAFDFLLPALLHDHKWNFNYTRVSIAADAAAPVSGFAYQYTLPADHVRSWKINEDDKQVFKVESGKLLTDQAPPIILEYGRLVTDPNLWGGMFRLMLSTYMASRLAGSIANDSKLGIEKLKEAQLYLSDAKAIDGQEGTPDVIQVTALTTDVRIG